jgi:hypothetical protein
MVREGGMTECRRISCWIAASRLSAIAIVLAGAACGGSDETVGPCYVGYEEPLFTIRAARDARTGAALPQILLSRFSYDGRSDLGLDFLTNHFGLEPRNVTIDDGELVCDIVCAFGGPTGSYTFTFHAIGHRDTTFTIAGADYAHGRGDCPAILSDGLDLELTLTPE